MEKSFQKVGVPEKDAQICAEILITSDLRGIESHGIGRLRMYIDRLRKGLIEVTNTSKIVKESPTTAVVDGNHGIGMVIGHQCMNLAIQKAQEFGLGAVAVRNSTHFGIDGYYPLMAVNHNMIGMSFTNARPAVTPTFGTLPTLGTNPIAFGAPTDEDFPFLYDAATSITQRGKIEVLNRKEKPVFDGWVIGEDGKPLVDAGEILDKLMVKEAALLPIGGASEEGGGHKGYGLSTIVEILSSSLQSGTFLFALSGFDAQGNETRYRVGHFFFALNIENFLPIENFKKNIGALLRDLRSVRKYPGKDRIYTAGEKEFETEQIIREQGVPINSNLLSDLKYIDKLLELGEFEP
ncbi:MAG: Ldh family oxidoreductase [Pelolinea sp.]|nr:Ldh family oxidoreductase [Pelolinea sp.]